METDPQTISAYLIYLSQHAPVEEQSHHNDLALVRSYDFDTTGFLMLNEFSHRSLMWRSTDLTMKRLLVSLPVSSVLAGISCLSACLAGCGTSDSGALHDNEQPVCQALLQA